MSSQSPRDRLIVPALPGGKSLKFKADTVIRITSTPGVEPAYTTHYIRKNGRPVMGNNLEVCSPSKFQVAVMHEGVDTWRFMGPDWSSEAEPGNWVRRRWSDRRPAAPDGMVIAAILAHQLDNEKPQFLILWFR